MAVWDTPPTDTAPGSGSAEHEAGDPPAVAARAHLQFHTRSVDEAVATVAKVYGPHALVLAPGREGLDMRFSRFDVGRLGVSSVAYGCPATGRPQRPSDYWMFALVVRGEVRVGDAYAGAGSVGVRAPGTVDDVAMSRDVRILNLQLSDQDLQAARRLLDGGGAAESPLQLSPHMTAGDGRAKAVAGIFRRLHELPDFPAPHGAMLERRWQEAVLLELLLAVSPQAPQGTPSSLPRSAVERALDFIDADLTAVGGLADLARVSEVSVRALTRGFQARVGTSPMRYLQQRRLEAARQDLLDARAPVTETALRWGFSNLGDFSIRYRSRFGESPSETLRRARGIFAGRSS